MTIDEASYPDIVNETEQTDFDDLADHVFKDDRALAGTIDHRQSEESVHEVESFGSIL